MTSEFEWEYVELSGGWDCGVNMWMSGWIVRQVCE